MEKPYTKPNRKRFGLAAMISAVIICISLITTGIVSWVNYQKYLDAVYRIHADYASEAAVLIEQFLPAEAWNRYGQAMIDYSYDELSDLALRQLIREDDYQSAAEGIQHITDAMALQNVSVFSVDFPGMDAETEEVFAVDESAYLSFLMDFVPADSDEPVYEAGDFDAWWETYSDLNDYRELFHTLADSREDLCLSESLADGNLLLTVYHPIMDGDTLAAVVMVSTDEVTIQDFVHSFFIETLLIGLGITAGLILLSLFFFYRRIVRPLKMIQRESERFSRDRTVAPDQLRSIRTGDEIQALAGSFVRMEEDIAHYIDEVQKVTAEKEHIRTELSVAAKIQEDMLPSLFPAFPQRSDFNIIASMDPAKEVGGDFYDFFLVDDTHLAMIIADVAGKGVPASLFMVIAKSLLKNRALMGGSPAEILFDVNNQLCDGNDAQMFVTVWLAILDLETGEGIAANAGHEHPLKQDADGTWSLIRYRHSPALALYEDLHFREHAFTLKPGERIFVYTDGLPEATNTCETLYGTDRMLQVLTSHPKATIEEAMQLITEDVNCFVGTADQFDDLTMLVFEYRGPQS